MTATRRSQVTSPDKNSPKKTLVDPPETVKSPGRKRKTVDVAAAAVEDIAEPSTSRPKRNARKSVLLSSGEYEVSYPGIKVEEPDIDEHIVSPPPPPAPRRKKPKVDAVVAEKSDNEIDVDGDTSTISDDGDLVSIDNRIGALDVAAEIDVETMSNLEDVNDDITLNMKDYSDGEGGYEEDDEPPHLEKVSDVKRKRGRPRKHPVGQTPFRRTGVTPRARLRAELGVFAPVARNKYIYDKPITKTEAEKINSFNVKLFEDDIGVTESGDIYATIIPGCLSYLLRKERIIELLTNRNEINTIRAQGWMTRRSPRLPPLVTTKSCFAFYVDGSSVSSIRDLSADELKPWTSSDPAEGEPVIKPNVRKHAITRQGGRLVPSKGDPRTADIHLTEYSAWLPRCLRLRKKIFYLSRSGHIIGNVLILYDFTVPGEPPVLVNLIHGNEAFKQPSTDIEFEKGHLLFVGDNEDPFMEDIVPGPRGEKYLQVRPDKLGWTNNKKLLLRYLINDPGLVDQAGFINLRIPVLPPLIETRGVFVHFAPAALVADKIHYAGDGLSPWTFQGASVNHRVRTVKRGLVQDSQGMFLASKEDWQTTGLALVETITILCRCPRLRKRVIYVQRNSIVMGVVCFIYEYMREGPIPEILKSGSKLNAMAGIENGAYSHPQITMGRKKSATLNENGEEEVDVEELVEEEVVLDDMHEHHVMHRAHDLALARITDDYEDLPEDSLDGGWDSEFQEELLTAEENSDPFFDGIRQLEGGHTYLTVRHKRIAANLETMLDYIANSSFVDDKGLVNTSKPSHPPLVKNNRSYVFFVSSNIIYPHDINRDDFSPWSANATPENPTCYRSKVRKVGVISDPKTGHFVMQDGDYKLFPYHLVSLYSIHPKESRLRKRITYLMDTESKVIISHVMIMYEYNSEGPIPRVNGPYGKRIIRKRPFRRPSDMPLDGVIDDVSDISETERESPFADGVQNNADGTLYVPLADLDFMNDRNRQLHYLVNKPHLLETMECLNNRIPMFPPLISGKGAYVFFIDGNEVDVRNLTCDGLAPWSENMHMSDGTIMCRRPKSHKVPLGMNRDGQLRVIRGRKPGPGETSDFMLHVYAATLPRLPRLKKRVVYLSKDGVQLGHSMIAYWYSDEGDIPEAVSHGNSVHTDGPYIRLPPSVREDARRLLLSMTPQDAAKELSEKHGIPINSRAIYNVKREMSRQLMPPPRAFQRGYDVKLEPGNYDMDDSMADYMPEWMGDSIVEDGAIDVGHTEEVSGTIRSPTRSLRKPLGAGIQMPRAHQCEQVFRYVSNLLGTRTENDTFDALWRTMLQKNEQRILHNIKTDFGVEIVADNGSRGAGVLEGNEEHVIEEGSLLHGIYEGDIVEEDVINGEIIHEMVLDEHEVHGETVEIVDMGQAGETGVKAIECGDSAEAAESERQLEEQHQEELRQIRGQHGAPSSMNAHEMLVSRHHHHEHDGNVIEEEVVVETEMASTSSAGVGEELVQMEEEYAEMSDDGAGEADAPEEQAIESAEDVPAEEKPETPHNTPEETVDGDGQPAAPNDMS